MGGLIMTAQLLLGLSILVILHELGHYLAARAFGIKVEKFYLFFDAWGFKLLSFKYKDCEYGIGWLPLGGYVKIAGMIDESMDTEQMSGPPQSWEFRSKPAWQRLIVMLAGVFVNIVLGIFIFWMITFKVGDTFIPNDKLVDGIAPGSIGKSIGLQTGDRITAVNDVAVVHFDDVMSSKVIMGGANLSVLRGTQTFNVRVPDNVLEQVADHGMSEFVQPRAVMHRIADVSKASGASAAGFRKGDSILRVNAKPVLFFDEYLAQVVNNPNKRISVDVMRKNQILTLTPTVAEDGTIGLIIPSNVPLDTMKYSLLASLPVGASKAWGLFVDNAKGIGKVVTGKVKATKAFTGPVGIANMFGSTVNWLKFWTLVGLLSMALALMNLLPIPALDGGHALFLLVEIAKGKPLSDKFMEKAQIVGFCIVLALMVFVLGNDIFKYFIK